MLGRVGVANLRRLILEMRDDVGPHLLRTNALLRQRFDAIPQLGTGIGLNGIFDDALVVIDEEPAQGHERIAILDFEKFKCADQSVGSTRAELLLIFNWRTLRPQINRSRQLRGGPVNHREQIVPLVGQIGNPAIMLYFHRSLLCLKILYSIPNSISIAQRSTIKW